MTDIGEGVEGAGGHNVQESYSMTSRRQWLKAQVTLLNLGVDAQGFEASGPTFYLHVDGDAAIIGRVMSAEAPDAEIIPK